MSSTNGVVVAPLGITVKSHKKIGSQGLRTIHRGIKLAFDGLSVWLVKVLEPIAKEIQWSYQDSFAVRSALLSVVVNSTCVVAKVDLKDFFLSGDASDISREVSMLVDNLALRDLVFSALFLLLDNQYVVTNTLQSTYKCIKGSGIGLRISAVVASLYFYAKVEQHVIVQASGLHKWVRYHDDVLAVLDNRPHLRAFFIALKMRAQPTYVVVCESVHSVGQERDPVGPNQGGQTSNGSCSFLDLQIDVVVPQMQVIASQHKPLTPLCPSSAHIQSIHLSWPKAVANRVYTLSGSSPVAVQKLIHRYKSAGAHPLTLKVLNNWHPSPPDSRSQPAQQGARMPFVFRYHPLFRHAFYRTMTLVPPPPELGLKIFSGWRNALPSLNGIVQSAALNSLKRDSGSREGVCFLFRFPNLQTNMLREFNITHMCDVLESV